MALLRRLVCGSGAVGLAISALPAFAAPFKDSLGNIHIQDASPGTSLQLEAGELKRTIKANFCGLVTVSKPNSTTPLPATVTVGGETINVSSLAELSLPSCKDNTLSEARPDNFRTPDGRVVVVGKTVGIGYPVIYPGVPASRSLRANACGFAKITNSTSNPAPETFAYGGQSYTTASLPVEVPGRCYDGKKFIYQP